jgi:hypothetical protein
VNHSTRDGITHEARGRTIDWRIMNDDPDIVVHGQIVFPPGDRPRRVARVVARVEDVSRADAPARTIADQLQEGVVLADSIDPRGHYAVRVHVDVAGTGNVTRGDFVSTKSYPALLEQEETTVEVRPI